MRTSFSLWITTPASGVDRPAPQDVEVEADGISQPSTSPIRRTPSSSPSTVRSRASSMRWRNTRRTNGSRSRWPACAGRGPAGQPEAGLDQRPVEAAAVVASPASRRA